jgi:GNAT superfamily N-acetyltransferase
VVGFAQLQSDGEIQAHLSLIAVDKRHRRRGVGRDLIETALRIAGGQRVDLVTDTASDFYSRLPHFRMLGFPLFPLYTGPDREVPDLYWKDGMKVAEPEKENCG